MLGFITLARDPIAGYLVFSIVAQNPQVETRVSFTKSIEGDIEDPMLFDNNFDEGKSFPGELICKSRGKYVPCLSTDLKREEQY